MIFVHHICLYIDRHTSTVIVLAHTQINVSNSYAKVRFNSKKSGICWMHKSTTPFIIFYYFFVSTVSKNGLDVMGLERGKKHLNFVILIEIQI